VWPFKSLFPHLIYAQQQKANFIETVQGQPRFSALHPTLEARL